MFPSYIGAAKHWWKLESNPKSQSLSYAQSWTALFRAFSSHRQPSAILSKVFPAEQTSWPNWQTLMACREADA